MMSKTLNILDILADDFTEKVANGQYDVNLRLRHGRTALMTIIENASNGSRQKTVSELIQLGADLFLVDDNYETALQYACKYRRIAITKLILSNIQNKNIRTRTRYVNQGGGLIRSKSPLYYACVSGKQKLVNILIEAGADIKQRTSVEQMPAVYYAAQMGKLNIVQNRHFSKLLDIEWPVNKRSPFYQHEFKTILLGAVDGRYIDVVRWLLWKNVRVKISGRESSQPVEFAADFEDDLSIFKLLIRKLTMEDMILRLGPWIMRGRKDLFDIIIPIVKQHKIHIPWSHQMNLLRFALRQTNHSWDAPPEIHAKRNIIAKYLIENGQSLNPRLVFNEHDWHTRASPLSIACRYKNSEMVKYMLINGADPNLGQYERPLYFLVRALFPSNGTPSWQGAWPLIQMCLDRGADPDNIISRKTQGYEDRGLFTCIIYSSYLYHGRVFPSLIIRDLIKRGLGFTVHWLDRIGRQSHMATLLWTGQDLWANQKFDNDDEVFIMKSPNKCPLGCGFYGCDQNSAPVRLMPCKHIICAGHARRLVETNAQVNNDRREGVGGNQLALQCPVCRESVKNIQLMSSKQVQHWHWFKSKIKKSIDRTHQQVEFQNENLKAIYKIYAPRISAGEKSWNQLTADEKKHYRKIHTTVLQLKKEERTLAKWHLAKKKEIQAKGIEERKQLRKDQYTTNLKLHF